MKKLLTILLGLLAFNLNAQDRDTFTICDSVKIYTECNDLSKFGREVTIRSNLRFLDESALIHKIRGISKVITTASNPYKMDILVASDFVPIYFTEALLDTLSMYWCGELFERTPTGLKQNTIFDYGNLTPKEIDSLEQIGYTVIKTSSLRISYDSLYFFTTIYDTVDVEGLSVYLCDDNFNYGVNITMYPTIKTVVKCRNCLTQTFMFNNFKSTSGVILKVRQLQPSTELRGKCLDCPIRYEWKEIDLTKYKEFIFIEKN